jgi:putative transposase
VWQGRFKAFPIQSDEHLWTVLRYVERNPVRAISLPVRKAQRWPWSSIGTPPGDILVPQLSVGPVPRPRNWLSWVNEPLTATELAVVRECVTRGRPYGAERWQKTTARRLGLEASLRSRGRPKKK